MEYSADFLADWARSDMVNPTDASRNPPLAMLLGLISAIDMSETLSIPVPIRWKNAQMLLMARLTDDYSSGSRYDYTGMDTMAFSQIVLNMDGIAEEERRSFFTQLAENAIVTMDIHGWIALLLGSGTEGPTASDFEPRIFQLIANMDYNDLSSRLVSDQQETVTAALELIVLQRFLSLRSHTTR